MSSVAEGVLNLKWDDALRLVVHTDSYYHNPAAQADGADKPSTCAGRVCQYIAHSSKTRLCVQGCLAAYTLWVVTHPSRTVPCSVTVTGTVHEATGHVVESASMWSSVAEALRRLILAAPPAAEAPHTITCYLYQSSEGMQLLMRAPMPMAVSIAHAVSGMLLIPLTWIQKETVPHMRFKQDEAAVAPQTAEAKKAVLQQARQARTMHSICGISTVVCMALMTIGGLAMRSHSVFSAAQTTAPVATTTTTTTTTTEATGERTAHGVCPMTRGMDFGKAIIGFAMPWGAFIPGIMASAKLRKVIPHAVVGGLICKACLAVPLARVLGGLYQRAIGIHVALPVQAVAAAGGEATIHIEQAVSGQLERAYYAGIASATVLVGAWAVMDTYKLVKAAAEDVQASKKTPASQARAAQAPAPAAVSREEL